MTCTVDFSALLRDIQLYHKKGDRKALEQILRLAIKFRLVFYEYCSANNLSDYLSDTLYKALLLELDNDEEESIEMAELAYIGIGNTLKNNDKITPEYHKQRLLLLHYFSDFLTDALISIFLQKYRHTHLLEARNTALECLRKMQLADMFKLENSFRDFIENDEQLCEVCNTIDNAAGFSEQEFSEAELMHNVLHAYLINKYKEVSKQ